MDFFNYRTSYREAGRDPAKRIVARRMRWDLAHGAHPYRIAGGSAVWDTDPFAATGSAKVSPEWQCDPRGVIDGHNVMTDGNLLQLLEVDRDVPISPLFVRDLAGRAVYIGPGPERKTMVEWESHGATKLDAAGNLVNPYAPLVTFPRYCHPASRVQGHELLEQVFLTKFRTLDMGQDYAELPSGADGNEEMAVRAEYPLANLYPYKYRLDTFYPDGYRLPQTQMLFALQSGVKPDKAKALGDAMVQAWESRKGGDAYEAWVDAMGGEAWREDMFRQGCTLIPTFEAYNGLNVVSPTFELEDAWPGRVVRGLHRVVDARADKAPAGTILEVRKPGYITHWHIEPAEVVVSDGSKYLSPNIADPAPLIPNLHLPHQRTVPIWEATWIPTHPAHFEAPALWGWDLISGRFLQLSGPLWDPLHYHYESVEVIRKAVKSPLPAEQNRWLVPVPESMQGRFYPMVPMKGFDVIAFEALERRRARASLPVSAVTHVPDKDFSCGVGYHPMPVEFEFELDPYWFPELHPLNRGHGLCPDALMERVCPVITPTVTPEHYADAIKADDTYPWLADKSMLATPGEKPLDNYPHLVRYLVPNMPLEELETLMPLPFLAEVERTRLARTAQQLWPGVDDLDTLEEMAGGLYQEVWDEREAALETMRFRHACYQNAPGIYRYAWWYGSSVGELQVMFSEWYLSQQKVNAALDALVEGGAPAPASTLADRLSERPGKQAMPVPGAAVETK